MEHKQVYQWNRELLYGQKSVLSTIPRGDVYEETDYQLPQELEIGDKIYWLATGAYTNSYSSVEFNGFPPLEVVYLD